MIFDISRDRYRTVTGVGGFPERLTENLFDLTDQAPQ